MPRTTSPTPGQKLCLALRRAAEHDRLAGTAPAGPTRNWLRGMSGGLRAQFAAGLRRRREALGLTLDRLAAVAGLPAADIALIERGERSPTEQVAIDLCWALDVASG